jgi:hypothetical protein
VYEGMEGAGKGGGESAGLYIFISLLDTPYFTLPPRWQYTYYQTQDVILKNFLVTLMYWRGLFFVLYEALAPFGDRFCGFSSTKETLGKPVT